jgi:hypothetical protein
MSRFRPKPMDARYSSLPGPVGSAPVSRSQYDRFRGSVIVGVSSCGLVRCRLTLLVNQIEATTSKGAQNVRSKLPALSLRLARMRRM